MNDTWKPRPEFLQVDCDLWNVLRDYETAHKVWMTTSVFTEAGKEAKRKKDEARAKYEIAFIASNRK